ncbi:MAG: phosphoribosylformylglycinamidine synthase subunit PurS [Elusimicrobiota bacterium]|jgi:phosphoribosylformylglycinamidine (FGAM) synthase PurS component
MRGTYIIEVSHKKGVSDPVGRKLAGELHHLGTHAVQYVTTAQLYRLVGNLSLEDRNRIAKDLLCDPIVQDSGDGTVGVPASGLSRSKAHPTVAVIDVWFKTGVTDVVGESVLKGIQDLSISGVSEVRTGMRYRLWGLRTAEPARKIAGALLANPLVHDSLIHVD